MGQSESIPTQQQWQEQRPEAMEQDSCSSGNGQQISSLIDYARHNYHENPTESLAALMQALTLNSGKASAQHAMERLRHELGDEIADHIGNRHLRMERAIELVQELIQDETTILYQNGQQDLLRQTMEDGSSVVCTRCSAVVASNRWQQHQNYWCDAIESDEEMKDDI